jgi:tetratricopeptide (TPR) repeat protein
VYLGGLGDESVELSPHLRSRHEVGRMLREAGVPVIEFRASIVIGSGSLSFEMIRALVERLPVMVTPRWLRVIAQPIAIDDLLAYLEAALTLDTSESRIYEIGGSERVSYGELMREYARQRGLRRVVLPVAALLLVLLCATGARADASQLARADALWARRAEGQVNAVARPEPVRAAIDAYERAIAAEPHRLEAYWKLLRAFWFSADFASADVAEERRTYEQAHAVAERAFALLAERVGGRDTFDELSPEALSERLPEADHQGAAELYFWHSVNLGAWSQIVGTLKSVRSGAVGRVHEATLRSIALDPDVEQGGAIRMLSRIHSEVPHIPLLSGWVDHAQAVSLAERALREYPNHPGNAYILGLAILSNAPDRFAEGLVLIEGTAALEPRPDHVVEDLAIQIDARKRLDAAAQAQ